MDSPPSRRWLHMQEYVGGAKIGVDKLLWGKRKEDTKFVEGRVLEELRGGVEGEYDKNILYWAF